MDRDAPDDPGRLIHKDARGAEKSTYLIWGVLPEHHVGAISIAPVDLGFSRDLLADDKNKDPKGEDIVELIAGEVAIMLDVDRNHRGILGRGHRVGLGVGVRALKRVEREAILLDLEQEWVRA